MEQEAERNGGMTFIGLTTCNLEAILQVFASLTSNSQWFYILNIPPCLFWIEWSLWGNAWAIVFLGWDIGCFKNWWAVSSENGSSETGSWEHSVYPRKHSPNPSVEIPGLQSTCLRRWWISMFGFGTVLKNPAQSIDSLCSHRCHKEASGGSSYQALSICSETMC